MKQELTETQLRVLTKIKELIRILGYPPSLQEVADALGVQLGSVYEVVTRLEKKEYISRTKGKYRSLVVYETANNELS